jgi:hypothetical protein
MRAEELTAKFGLAGVLDFIETEHGLVKLDDLSLTQPINCALVMSGDAGEGFILVWSHDRRLT